MFTYSRLFHPPASCTMHRNVNRFSRRNFIQRAIAATATFACAPACRRTAITDRNDFDHLRSKLKGRVIVPNDPSYEASRRVFYWNPSTQRTPQLIVQCAAEDDVARAIDFAQHHNLELATRGGGHAHLGWGTSNGLVIDLSAMTRITIDPQRQTARFQGGALSGQVAAAAGRYGLAPVLGQCPGVGAAGVTLGGGLGWLSGLHGASCDNLLAARLVTADARVVTANAQQNPDLFWAIRGAGANFGVATSLECRLHPITQVTGGDIHYSPRDAKPVLRFFRELMDNAPDAFQATLNLTPGPRGVFISLCHAGTETQADQTLQTLRAIAPVTHESIQRQDFANLAERPAATNPGNAPPPAFRGIQTVYRSTLSDDLIDIIIDRFAKASPQVIMGISHYLHGHVTRLAPSSTAFPLREKGGSNVRLAYTWNDPAEGQRLTDWADQSLRLLRPPTNEQIYANFQTYQTEHGAAAVYGKNTQRLTAIKSKFDPHNLFQRNSNIPPTPIEDARKT